MVKRLKAADPNNKLVASAENKYEKLLKDLEKKTGRDLGGGSTTAAGPAAERPLPPKPEAKPALGKTTPPAAEARKTGAPSAKVPYAARQPLDQAERALTGAEDSISKLTDPAQRADMKESYLKRIESNLAHARASLADAKEEAAKKGVTSHPEFDEIEAKIAAVEKKMTEARGGYKKEKTAAAAASKVVESDVKALQAEYEKASSFFQRAAGTAIYYNDLGPVEKLIAEIEEFEKNQASDLKAKIGAFASKYGSTKDEIEKKAELWATRARRAPATPTPRFVEGIANAKKTRAVMADDLVRKASDMMGRSNSSIHDFSRIKNQKMIRDNGRMAARFDADNPKVKEFTARMEDWAKKDPESLNGKIEAAKWPGRVANAPADADKLAGKGSESRRMLAVVITGPWRVLKKNILGEPIQYGLPVLGAVQMESEKDLNLARAYALTVLTEEYKGVKQAPPFIGSAVGDSYYIRPSKVKK